MEPAATYRATTINLRAASAQRTLIDQAARLSGKSRTDFMLEAACDKAQQVLLDHTLFALDTEGFQRFSELLDAPLANTEAVDRLLQRVPAWERQDK